MSHWMISNLMILLATMLHWKSFQCNFHCADCCLFSAYAENCFQWHVTLITLFLWQHCIMANCLRKLLSITLAWSLCTEWRKVQKYVLLLEHLKLIVNCSCVQKENTKQKEIVHLHGWPQNLAEEICRNPVAALIKWMFGFMHACPQRMKATHLSLMFLPKITPFLWFLAETPFQSFFLTPQELINHNFRMSKLRI